MRKIIGKLTVSTEFCTTSRSGTLPLGYLRLGYSVKQFGTDFLGNMTSIRTFKRMLSHRKNTQLLIRTNSCGSYLKICENKTKWQAKLSTHCLYLAIKLNPKIFSHKQRICTTEYFQNPVSLRSVIFLCDDTNPRKTMCFVSVCRYCYVYYTNYSDHVRRNLKFFSIV
jgi:hypothetical protein